MGTRQRGPFSRCHKVPFLLAISNHDHRERNHQGLDNQLLQRSPPPVSLAADVQRRERLGGWLNFYHREAA